MRGLGAFVFLLLFCGVQSQGGKFQQRGWSAEVKGTLKSWLGHANKPCENIGGAEPCVPKPIEKTVKNGVTEEVEPGKTKFEEKSQKQEKPTPAKVSDEEGKKPKDPNKKAEQESAGPAKSKSRAQKDAKAQHFSYPEADASQPGLPSEQGKAKLQDAPAVQYRLNSGSAWKKFPECVYQQMQSPLPIQTKSAIVDEDPKPLGQDYKATDVNVINTGYTYQLNGKFGDLTHNGTKYTAQYAVLHAPSEHQVDSYAADAEMQIIHRSKNEEVAIVSILFDSGLPSQFLKEVLYKKRMPKEPEKLPVKLNLATLESAKSRTVPGGDQFLVFKGAYWTYDGRFTTPNCGKAKYFVMERRPSISPIQIKNLKHGFDGHWLKNGNAREQQMANGRNVTYHDPRNLQPVPLDTKAKGLRHMIGKWSGIPRPIEGRVKTEAGDFAPGVPADTAKQLIEGSF